MNSKAKRLLSWLCVLALCMSLLPMTALAAGRSGTPTEAQNQVVENGGTVYYDKEGKEVTASQLGDNNSVVEMTKTVASTEKENEFEVTLNVKTNQNVTELSSENPDAAVVLVIDTSGSMGYCSECDAEDEHQQGWVNEGIFYDHWVYYDHPFQSRLSAAQSAAKDFLEEFSELKAGNEDTAHRWVQIISFDSDATREQDWIDVSTQEGLETANETIDNLTANGGTNIEGGLLLANNNLDDAQKAEQKLDGVDYIYTILLTDGSPTNYVSDTNHTKNSLTDITGDGNGMGTSRHCYEDVPNIAAQIKNASKLSKLYSICYGDVWNDTLYSTENWQHREDVTVGEWLSDFSTDAYQSDSAQDLFDNFNSILSQIILATQAFQVTDTMGEYMTNATVTSGEGTVKGNTLTWNLLTSTPDESSTIKTDKDGNVSGFLSYTLTYTVKLDNLQPVQSDLIEETDVNSNAILTYAVKENGVWTGGTDNEPLVGYFAKPTVKSHYGNLTFTKKGSDGKNLDGVTFTLTTEDKDGWEMKATSQNNGVVKFENIPSGHTYTLTESNTPDGYTPADPINVTVSYGQVTTSASEDGGSNIQDGTLINQANTGRLTVTKTVKGLDDGLSALPENFAITVTNSEDEPVATLRYGTDNNENDTTYYSETGTWTVSNLTPGSYTVSEINYYVDGYSVATSGDDSATVSAGGTATVTLTNTYTKLVPGLEVTKTLDKVNGEEYTEGMVKVNDELTYTITVKNSGETVLENISVSDTLTIGEATSALSLYNNEECTGDAVTSITSLDPDATQTLYATYTVLAADAGKTITNTAVAEASDGTEDEPDNPPAVEVENPDWTVTKTVDDANPAVGDTITYTITVTNTGNTTLNGLTVTDTMTGDRTVTWGTLPESVTSSEDGTLTISTLAPEATVTITGTYKVVDSDAGASFKNSVTVSDDGNEEKPDEPPVVTVDNPGISIDKALTSVTRGDNTIGTDNYSAQVGDELTYTITVTNTGNTPFDSVTVEDSMWGEGKVETISIEDVNYPCSVDGGYWNAVTPDGPWGSVDRLEPGSSWTCTYTYTVQPDDIGLENIFNTATASTGDDEDDPKDEDTVTIPMDDYTVTITPADITIYTGGDGYSGVTDGSGNVIAGTESSGLPEPGYHIDLPDAVTTWLQNHNIDLRDAANLANLLAFQYSDNNGNIIRNWDLENQGVYSRNSDGSVARYVYSLSPNTITGDNEGVKVRLAFTDDGAIVTTDNIQMDESTVSASYEMTIYDGGLQQSEIKAVFTADDESIACTVDIETGHLLVKSVTNQATTTNGIENLSEAVTDTGTITAVADSGVTYYVNDSEVQVANNDNRVQLLVDEVSNSDDFNAAMGKDAVGKVNTKLGEGNTLSNATYDLAYMDLVDTQNGNAVVTMGEGNSLTLYWPVPEDAAADSEFHVVHYTGMDREDVVPADDLSDAAHAFLETNVATVNGEKYVTFTTSTFSPFVLVYEKAPDPVATLDVDKSLTAVNGQTYTNGSVSVGDTLTYTITVKNAGNVDLSNVTVTDTLSNGRTVTWLNLPDGVTNTDGTLTISSLTAGASVELTATYKVLKSDANGTLTNTVTVNGTTPGGEEVPGTDEEETPVDPYYPPAPPVDPPELNTEDHYAYIVGYPDGTVRPEGNITRAEVATIFFRLLTDESRDEFWSQTNPYSDVSADDWYNNAVSTLTNAGILDGYEDGTFRPNGNITRAEFATITSRFFDATYEGEDLFPDIDGHWAKDYINESANAGIVNGYEDGTFRPQKLITRAEAMTMVNRTIDRHPDAEHLLDDMITWPDNPETAWYYEQVQEATNSHTYTMHTDAEKNPYEIWSELLPVRDWAQLEKEWSDAHSGQTGGEVV